jgi:hypothetical protein
MFTASFYFLGVAIFILAASLCVSWAKRAGRCVEVDLDALHAATICLPVGTRAAPEGTATTLYKELTWDEKAKWKDMKAMWTRWYHQCQAKAFLKQKAMYSWARTMALSAMLCLMGVLLEAQFDQPITLGAILAGFRDPRLAASGFPSSPLHPFQSTQSPATDAAPRM